MSTIVAREAVGPEKTWSLVELTWGVSLLLALVFAHRAALAGMVEQWNVSPMYSYGFTVPLVSLFLLWSQRERFNRLTPAPARFAGGAVICVGLAMLTAGAAAGVQVVQQLAFLVSLVGVVLAVFGTAYLRTSWAAIAYLLLMIPLWDAFTEPLHWPFQERSAVIGAWILQNVGIPAHREGTFLTLPNVQLEVARACSGVNYLVAVIALGLPLAYLYLASTWRRLVLLGFAIGVAALSNGLRVALIGLLAYWEIGSPLHGPFHVLHGLFVAGVGYVALFAGLKLLSTREPDVERAVADDTRPANITRVPRLEVLAILAVFVLAGSGVLAREPKTVPLAGGTLRLPIEMGEWTAEIGRWPSPVSALWPGADSEDHRRYRHESGATADVFVGYFAKQTQDRELASFRNAGLHRRARPVRLGTTGADGFVANLSESSDGVDTLFWYDMDAAIQTNQYQTKLLTTWNAIIKGRTNGAVVAITMPRQNGSPEPAAELTELASALHRNLQPVLRPNSTRQ